MSIQKMNVGRWQRFEAAIVNDRVYDDPYREVDLTVCYTRPDGTSVDFPGFYTSNHTWKFRFMPDVEGQWEYHARFSDGSGETRGSFDCQSSNIPGLFWKDKNNPIWFGYKGGGQLLVRSLHVGDRFFAENWEEAERTAFLDWLQERKYNMLSIASHYLNRSSKGRGLDWQTPGLWAGSAPNPGEYDKMERILDELADRRILVFPFGGFFSKESNFPREAADQELYIKYTVARLGTYWNIMFNVAGPEPLLPTGGYYVSMEDIDRLAPLIKKYDVFDHLLTVHNQTGPDAFKDKPYLSCGTMQGPKTLDRRILYNGLLESHSAQYPLYAQETLWSNNIFHLNKGEEYTNEDIRKNTYVIMMAAAALNFSDNQGDSSTGFSGTMNPAEAVEERHLLVSRVWDLFETLPYHRMVPRQDLVDGGYCLAREGQSYLVYLDEGGAIHLTLPEGLYQVEWINAREPKDRCTFQYQGGSNTFCASDLQDWLLYVKKI